MTHTKAKVFGIGLSKTGTTSLAAALEQLDYRVSDFPTDHLTREELEAGNFHLSVLAHNDALTDIMAANYFAQYDEAYPGSKFILTIRDCSSWLRSIEKHWAYAERWDRERRYGEDFSRMRYFIHTATYGCPSFNASRYQQAYEQHNAAVRHYFADRPGDLLVMNVCEGEGFEKLCPFLGLPIKNESFPRTNSREDRIAREQWLDHYIGLVADLDAHVPEKTDIILIDDTAFADSPLTDRWNVRPFGETAQLGGTPADNHDALARLDGMLASGADTVVLPWSAFWWLEHYTSLRTRLEAAFTCLSRSPHALIFRASRTRTTSTASTKAGPADTLTD